MRHPLHRGAILALLLLVGVVGAPVPATAATDDAEVTVSPTDQRVAPNSTVTYAVTVDTLDDGVGAYDLTVSVNDTATARIVDVHNEIGGTAQAEVTADSARIVAAGGDTVDSGDALLATVTVQGQAAGNTTLSVVPHAISDEHGGDQYGIATVHNASVTVADAPAPATAVTLTPPGQGITAGTRATYEITATDVRGGVGAYDLTVTLDETATARIVDVTNEIGGATQTQVTDASARLFVTGGDTVDDGEDVVLATVTVAGERAGEATLSVAPQSISPETRAETYRITETEGATLTVAETTTTIGNSDAPAADPDGDGIVEDVNGDGEVTPGDATVLYNAIRAADPAVITNPEMCDVTGDRQIDRADARALFRQALNG